MKKSTNDATPKPFYIKNRDSYLSVDGRYYCYDVWDDDAKRMVTQKIEVDKDLSLDITLVLDEIDHKEDLQEYYARKSRDTLFEREIKQNQQIPNDEDFINPWENIGKKGNSPEDIIFAEPEAENPQVVKIRSIIDEKCTDEQKKFIADHFGKGMQLEEMRQAEAIRMGKLSSSAAMTNRKNKILDKIAKALGVERIKRHYNRSSRKD